MICYQQVHVEPQSPSLPLPLWRSLAVELEWMCISWTGRHRFHPCLCEIEKLKYIPMFSSGWESRLTPHGLLRRSTASVRKVKWMCIRGVCVRRRRSWKTCNTPILLVNNWMIPLQFAFTTHFSFYNLTYSPM